MTATQQIKRALEEIWNTKPCMCPGHLVRWSTKDGRGRRVVWTSLIDLWYTKGAARSPKGRRHSRPPFLSRLYGQVWLFTHNRNKQRT